MFTKIEQLFGSVATCNTAMHSPKLPKQVNGSSLKSNLECARAYTILFKTTSASKLNLSAIGRSQFSGLYGRPSRRTRPSGSVKPSQVRWALFLSGLKVFSVSIKITFPPWCPIPGICDVTQMVWAIWVFPVRNSPKTLIIKFWWRKFGCNILLMTYSRWQYWFSAIKTWRV